MNVELGKLNGYVDKVMVDAINLKINPLEGDMLRARKGIFPAYHMNKKHWVTAILDGSISHEEIMKLIETSYELTK